MKRLFLVLMLFILLIGCSGGSDAFFGLIECGCDENIESTIATYGPPEEINTYDSGDYHSYDYWWWCQGVEVTYTWGGSAGCSCQESVYTFDPIC